MSGDKQLPNLAELRRRYETVVNDLISSPPPRQKSAAEVEQYERAEWYCDLHEVLMRWIDDNKRPS